MIFLPQIFFLFGGCVCGEGGCWRANVMMEEKAELSHSAGRLKADARSSALSGRLPVRLWLPHFPLHPFPHSPARRALL